ncbi:MAG: hypothetical protein E7218_02760 [Anaerofustis stercorihominis]|nr:hypothetical protein [Anaerofustis stercorihominis]
MKKEIRSAVPDIITALLYIVSGLIMRNHFDILIKYVYYTSTATLMLGAVRSALTYLMTDKDSAMLESVVNIAFGLILLLKPSSLLFMMKFISAAYMALLAFIHIIAIVQRRKDNAGSRTGYFILIPFEIFSSLRLLFGKEHRLQQLNRWLGMYFMVYGLCVFLDIVASFNIFHRRKKKKFHIPLPAIICAFIPKRILKSINKLMDNNELPIDKINHTSDDTESDIEIFIHMADTLYGQVGHVDLCFDNYVLSYGNYDESSYRLNGMLGDGVIEVIDRNKYIRFCLEVSNKHIVSFGIKLNDEDKMRMQWKLKDIFENLTPWEPPIMSSQSDLISSTQYELDYASSLYKATDALFYKFKDGKYNKFKTYFGLSTNCAALVQEITSKIGVSLFDFSGILTPGTYYDYLDSEFRRKNSFVVSKTLYALPNRS